MNSYAFAFGILGAGLLVAVVLWFLPRLRRRREVRRFRAELTHIDLVTLAWRESLVEQDPSDDVPTPIPDNRRSRREQRRRQRDGDGDALV